MGERPANASWSIEKYLADSGDFTIGCWEYKERNKLSLVAPVEDDECSSSSTTTSSRRQSDLEETLSQASNTDASSTSQPPRNLRPPWHRQDNMNYDYSLPCEFKVVGCNHEFPPENWEDWITHTRSHFVGNLPPLEAVCIFCDGPLGTFKYHQNPASNWRHRMIHIGEHHMKHAQGTRPDYFVIEHLHKHNLLTTTDFKHSMEYSERLVPIDCLVPYSYKTDEKKNRERRELEVKDDLEKERREMRKKLRRSMS